nr:hypothetical protein Iba_chr01fCG7130 [Ipomoea batatas]
MENEIKGRFTFSVYTGWRRNEHFIDGGRKVNYARSEGRDLQEMHYSDHEVGRLAMVKVLVADKLSGLPANFGARLLLRKTHALIRENLLGEHASEKNLPKPSCDLAINSQSILNGFLSISPFSLKVGENRAVNNVLICWRLARSSTSTISSEEVGGR